MILSRSFYEMVKILVANQRSTRTKIEFYFSLFCFIYTSRLMFTAYVIYTGYKSTLKWFNFLEFDYLLSFLYQNSHLFEPFFLLIWNIYISFWFYCEYSIYNLNNRNTKTWQWWHQLVIENQDCYYESLLPPKTMENLTAKRVQQMIRSIEKSNKNISSLVPHTLLKYGYKLWVRLHIWYHMDNVNREQLFRKPLTIMSNLSPKIREHVLLFLRIADMFGYFFQWTVGKSGK